MKNKKKIIIWSIIIIVLLAITWAVYYFTIIPKQTKNSCNRDIQCNDDQYVTCMHDIGGWNCHCRCKPYIWF